jgi:ABC-type spermidine/putrescine transport system permease subunit II
VTLIVLAIAFYRLYQKAGFSGAIGLLMLVPVVNLGVALYLAFAEWPVLTELARVKLLAASAPFAATTDPMRPAPPDDSADATGSAVPRTS